MNNDRLQKLRTMLEEELATLQQLREEEPVVEYTELFSVDNHPADAATDLTTVTTEMTLIEIREEEIEKIKTALNAMDEETYGQCLVCKMDIPFERLEVVPTTLTCVEHADHAIEP